MQSDRRQGHSQKRQSALYATTAVQSYIRGSLAWPYRAGVDVDVVFSVFLDGLLLR